MPWFVTVHDTSIWAGLPITISLVTFTAVKVRSAYGAKVTVVMLERTLFASAPVSMTRLFASVFTRR